MKIFMIFRNAFDMPVDFLIVDSDYSHYLSGRRKMTSMFSAADIFTDIYLLPYRTMLWISEHSAHGTLCIHFLSSICFSPFSYMSSCFIFRRAFASSLFHISRLDFITLKRRHWLLRRWLSDIFFEKPPPRFDVMPGILDARRFLWHYWKFHMVFAFQRCISKI